MSILLAERRPDVYLLRQIYDPDLNGLDPEASGLVIPGKGSLVVDMTDEPSLTYTLYVVESVDETTFKSTLVPATSLIDNHLVGDKLMSYGNDVYMLFYDTRVSPTKLMVGSNLMILGDNSAEYVLYKHEQDGTKTPISINRDSLGNITGNRVPIVDVYNPPTGVRRPNDCETTYPMTDNDLVTMEVYDSAGTKNMDIILITKLATVLTDLTTTDNIITGFDVSANQEKPTGELVVFVGQNKEDLAIFPEVEFSTGHKLIVPVDDAVCFMYGWEDVKSELPGMEYNILFKYYLAPNVQSTIALGDQVRWVEVTKKVVIEAPGLNDVITKVSPMPYFNVGDNKWDMRYFAYYESRNNLIDVTNEVFYRDTVAFDGDLANAGIWQSLQLGIHLTNDAGIPYDYEQDIEVLIDQLSEAQPFLIRDDVAAVLIYGAQDASHNRPRMRYDGSVPGSETYTISTADFPTTEKFVEMFFLNSNPPWIEPDESISPYPTHFIIRNSQGEPLLVEPLPIAQYTMVSTLVITGTPDEYVDSTLIFEFLEEAGTGYNVLYGVPVDVRAI